MYKFNSATKVCEIDFSKLTEEEAKILLRMRNPKSRVSVDEAKEQTDWVINFMNVGESGAIRKINSISALASDDIDFAAELKFNGIGVPDTLIYVVNFDDSLGFAIISADTRIDGPILAFTGDGSLMDSIDNPGVSIFLEHLEDYMLNSIIEAEQQKGSLIDSLIEKLNIETNTKATSPGIIPIPYDPSRTSEMTTTRNKIGPLIRVEWGQGTPLKNAWSYSSFGFNDSLKYKDCKDKDGNIKNNGRVLVGCVAVAVAQIMSYWNYPPKIGDYSFDWDKLNEYTGNYRLPYYPNAAQTHIDKAPPEIKSQAANLMERIGNGVSMDYGCDGSSANKYSGPNFLVSNGFSLQSIMLTPRGLSQAVLTGYNSKTAIASMNRNEPLIVRGCSKKIRHKFLGIKVYTSYENCHQWVIDGYLERRTLVLLDNDFIVVNSYNSDYIHNNWGWNGNKNGYYKSGVFNSGPGPDIYSDGTTKSGEDYNYQYEIEMTPYIRR